MGEYADDYFRNEIRWRYGFDPGSMYGDEDEKKFKCPKCGKMLKTEQGVLDHIRDKHEVVGI